MRFALCLVGKLTCHRTTFGSAAIPTHATATAMHFRANAGLISLTDKLTNDRYLVDTGATWSIVPCNQNSSPSGPLLKGADGQPIPSWGFIKKLQFQGKLFISSFLQATVVGPILDIDFLRKFKVTVVSDIHQIQFACTAAASPTLFLPSAARPPHFCFQWPRLPRHICSARHQFHQSLLDPPPSLQKIPDSVPADVKALLQKFPAILRTGDVKPTPTQGIEYHIHTSSHPPVFAISRRLDPEKLQMAKAEFQKLGSAGIIRRSNHHGPPLCTWYRKKTDCDGLVVAITSI
jgi:hypothetical protein